MSEIKDYSTTAGSNNGAGDLGMPEGMAPSQVNNSWREGIARTKRWYEDISAINSTAGTVPAYTLAASRTISALAIGDFYIVRCHSTLTGSAGATLAVDGLTAKPIVTTSQTALSAGQLVINGIYEFAYDATSDTYIVLNPTTAAVGTGFRVHRNAVNQGNQAASSPVEVEWTTAAQNDGGYFQLNGVTTPVLVGDNGFTVPVTGWYLFTASVGSGTSIQTDQWALTQLYVDPLGADAAVKELNGTKYTMGITGELISQLSAVLYCTATDIVSVRWRWEGTGTNQVSGVIKDTFFSGIRLS